MKKWYEMTKEELKEVISKEELDISSIITDIAKENLKAIEGVSVLIEAFYEVMQKNYDLPYTFTDKVSDCISYIIKEIELSEDTIDDIIELYWYKDELIYKVIRQQEFTKENMERFLKRRSTDVDLWYLYAFQNLEMYPLIVLENADLNSIPPEYFITKFDWDEIFKKELSSKAQKKLVEYLLNPNKGYEMSYLEDNEFIADYFDEYPDSDLWYNISLSERNSKINNESYYNKVNDNLYNNFWVYLIDRLMETKDLDDDVRSIIQESSVLMGGYYTSCKERLEDSYGEEEFSNFLKIYKDIKEKKQIKWINAIIQSME